LTKEYQKQFLKKKDLFSKSIDPFCSNKAYFQSNPLNFRTRIEFGIKEFDGHLGFSMTEDGQTIEVEKMSICHERINDLMKEILVVLEENKEFSKKIFQIEFQVARNNEAMVTLIYHRELDLKWEKKAEEIAYQLDCSLIGRSRRQLLIKGKNFVTENYKSKKNNYPLQLFEQCFSQTNPGICDDMLAWVEENSHSKDDILELHCGLGTFTILFSKLYSSVLATENSRPSIAGLKENLALNSVNNVFYARLSGSETLDALNQVREFRRLKEIDLNKFNFSTIFLDPPRSGLDNGTLAEVSSFEQIIYISCGFQSVLRDLKQLNKTHKIKSAALFDQFPYTNHMETGFVLEKRQPDQV
jgi:tRNA (uracil-5-)-methyltransferase